MSDLLHDAARRFGDAPAFVSATGTMSFREWDERATPVTERRHVVGLVARSDPTFAVQLARIWRSGGIACLLGAGDPRHATVQAQLGDGPAGDAAILVLTSGSTGRPRAIAHSLATLAAAAEAAGTRVPFGPGDCWAATLPFHHVGGLALLFRALVGGGAIAVAPTWREALALDVTHASLVAAQIDSVAEPRRLRAVLVGGGPVAVPQLARALDRGIPALATYGCTELGSQIATVVAPMRREDLGSAGAPLPHVQVTLADGAIRVRGSSLALGAWDGRELHPLAAADGFYDTGDLGHFDDAGRLHVIGRRDLMFASGGEKISPEVIERALLALPGVREAVVVPVAHERWGARPIAWVDAADVDLRDALRETLPAVLVPDRVLRLPADCPGWPGKRDRAWLRAQAERI